MKKKRLCLLISTMGPGGMQKAMSVLADYFADREDVETHLVLYGISHEVFFRLPENVILHTPDFVFNNNRRFISTIKTLLFLRRRIRELAPSSVLSYGEYWNSFVLIALFGLKFPVFVSDRCQPDKSLGKLHDFLRKILYPRAAGIITQTGKAKDIYSRLVANSNIAVIGNPIQPLPFVKDFHEREKVVLSVGRLIASKHHDMLIDIFLSISQPGWKLVIVGGDISYSNRQKELQQKIDALDAGDRVVLAGNVSNVGDYYLNSRIFAFTSSSEGFPNVIGEAMAAGLPVVAFDCIAGPSDMIEDGKNGFLVPLFDQEVFAEKLSAVMSDESLQLSMGKASEELIRKFVPDQIGLKYHRVLFS
ncbi:MAG: glycosyltransferase [Bacteroidales bacterium]|nr:glycosyltransferase [Bacteroidales bacterium]